MAINYVIGGTVYREQFEIELLVKCNNDNRQKTGFEIYILSFNGVTLEYLLHQQNRKYNTIKICNAQIFLCS